MSKNDLPKEILSAYFHFHYKDHFANLIIGVLSSFNNVAFNNVVSWSLYISR